MSLAQVQLCTGEAEAASVQHEHDLIERAKRDPDAFAALYQQHYPMLVDYVYRRTGDVHATEDLVADVFVIVLRSLSGYRYRGVPLRYWLLRIATRTVNRWAGRHRRRLQAPLDADQMADRVESPLGGRSEAEPVQRALLTLKPKYQAVLALYHLEGLSVRETAAVLGCREGTSRNETCHNHAPGRQPRGAGRIPNDRDETCRITLRSRLRAVNSSRRRSSRHRPSCSPSG